MSLLSVRHCPKFASVVFATSAVSATNATTYTFSGKSFSVASSDRKVVVSICASGNLADPIISTVTIGGVTAAVVVSLHGTPATQDYLMALWQAAVPTGATGDVVVTFTGQIGSCGIGIWAVYGAATAASDTDSSGSDPATVSLDVPASGIAIGAHQAGDGTFTWTGLTENFDEVVQVSGQYHSGASAEFSAQQTGLSITSDQSVGDSTNTMVVASWGPA